MRGRVSSPIFLFMCPNAKISVMSGEQAVWVLAQVQADAKAHDGGARIPEEEAVFKLLMMIIMNGRTATVTQTRRW